MSIIDYVTQRERQLTDTTAILGNTDAILDTSAILGTTPPIQDDNQTEQPVGIAYYTPDGNRIGTNGNSIGVRIVVTDNREARALSRIRGNIDTATVRSGVTLPSDAVLRESLDVLQRTIDNGGRREEASLVMNCGKPERSETGPYRNEYGLTTVYMPRIPVGKTVADVEATIHSHPTAMDWEEETGAITFWADATVPGPEDPDIFRDFQTNIIVGPLGRPRLAVRESDIEGNIIRIIPPQPQPNIGIAIFNNHSRRPLLILNREAVERILGM